MHAYGERTRALRMTEHELRQKVDRLLEQCGRELFCQPPTANGGMLHVSEIYMLLGVGPGPSYSALELLIRMTGEDGDG